MAGLWTGWSYEPTAAVERPPVEAAEPLPVEVG